MTHMIKPRHLSAYLKTQLDNGNDRLTWEEIAKGIFGIKTVTEDHIEEIRHCWHLSEKRLRARGTCAILVTEMYFDAFDKREPNTEQQMTACIALHGRPAAGVRLLTLKGSRNDPMAIMFLHLHSRNAQGMQAAILDRIAVEFSKGRLSKNRGQKLANRTMQPTLPLHEKEFDKLMRN